MNIEYQSTKSEQDADLHGQNEQRGDKLTAENDSVTGGRANQPLQGAVILLS